MQYEGIVIRPPSEAESLILQATFGCSYNKCTFCPTYKGRRFEIKDQDRLFAEIEEAASWGPYYRRVFLADGDVLIMPQKKLLPVLDKIRQTMPWIERIGVYGNTKSVLRKSVEELNELSDHGLGIVYLGLESGDDEILVRIKKGVTAEQMIQAAEHIRKTPIKLSVTALLGIAGKTDSKRHAVATGKVLTAMDPEFAACLMVMVVPGTELHAQMEAGEFELPDPFGLLEELALVLKNTDMTDGMFMANHASNYLPIRVKMPGEKEKAVRLIERVIEERDPKLLKPEQFRAL